MRMTIGSDGSEPSGWLVGWWTQVLRRFQTVTNCCYYYSRTDSTTSSATATSIVTVCSVSLWSARNKLVHYCSRRRSEHNLRWTRLVWRWWSLQRLFSNKLLLLQSLTFRARFATAVHWQCIALIQMCTSAAPRRRPRRWWTVKKFILVSRARHYNS